MTEEMIAKCMIQAQAYGKDLWLTPSDGTKAPLSSYSIIDFNTWVS